MKRKHKLPKIMLATALAVTTAFTGTHVMRAAMESTIRYGDLDDDGKISLRDAQTSLRAALGITDRTPYEKTGDVDGNGKVDLHDCRLILRAALGIINTFPIEKMDVADTAESSQEPAPEPTVKPSQSVETLWPNLPEDYYLKNGMPWPNLPEDFYEEGGVYRDYSEWYELIWPGKIYDKWCRKQGLELNENYIYRLYPDGGTYEKIYAGYTEIHHLDGTVETVYPDGEECLHEWEDVMSTRIVKAAWDETEYKTVTEETEVIIPHARDNDGNRINFTALYNEYLKSGDYKNETIEKSCIYDILEYGIERAMKKGYTREEALKSIPAVNSFSWFAGYLSWEMIDKYMKLANWDGVLQNGHVVSDPWTSLSQSFETDFMTIERQVPIGNVINHPAEIEEYVDHYRCTKCGKKVKTCTEKYE